MGRWLEPPRVWTALAGFALVASVAGPALGAEERDGFTSYQLRWDVPESFGCGNADAFDEALQQRVGRHAFAVDAPHALIVEIVKRDQSWNLVVRVLDPAGAVSAERKMSSSDRDCNGVVASAALAVELMLSGEGPTEPHSAEQGSEPPAVETRELEAQPVEANRADPPREVPPAPPSDSTQPPLASPPLASPPLAPRATVPMDLQRPNSALRSFELEVLGAGYLWILPDPTFGVHATLGYRVSPRWSLWIGGGLSQDWDGSYAFGEQRVRLSLALQHLDLSVQRTLFQNARWRHDVGVLALAGRLTPTVEGATSLRQSPLLWSGFGAGARTRLELAWGLGLSARGSLVIPVTRERLTEADGALLAQVPPVGGLVTTGISADW